MPRKLSSIKKRKTIGIALGGGASKGLAHIGVLKALNEARIPIDFIAGTSMGALVGGWYAMDGDISSMEDFISALQKRERKSLAKISLKKGQPRIKNEFIMKIIERQFGSHRIENCKIPFKAVATNVKTGDEIILAKGKMADAIKASTAIPIVFDPVEVNGKILADGGLVNPVPADVVRKMGADIVIAVDVSTQWFDVSAFSANLLNLKNIESAVYSLIGVFGYQIAKERLKRADMVLNPPVLGYRWLDFSEAEHIIAAGYKTAKDSYDKICRLTKCKLPEKGALEEFWGFVLDRD
ncbi:MAG: patatin-like phospholipase family protein [Parcubacteria group bacterium]